MGSMYGSIYGGTYKYEDFDKSGDTYTLKPTVAHYTSENNTQPGMPKYRDLNDDGYVNNGTNKLGDMGDMVVVGTLHHAINIPSAVASTGRDMV